LHDYDLHYPAWYHARWTNSAVDNLDVMDIMDDTMKIYLQVARDLEEPDGINKKALDLLVHQRCGERGLFHHVKETILLIPYFSFFHDDFYTSIKSLLRKNESFRVYFILQPKKPSF
jgi:hypothetical protein